MTAVGSALSRLLRPRLERAAKAVRIARRRARQTKDIPPDFDEQAIRILEAVGGYTMTSPERVHALVGAVRYVVANGIPGDFVECGVWRGGSSMAVALMLRESNEEDRHLYLYDTFEGMSAPTEEDVTFDGRAADEKFKRRRTAGDSSDWCRAGLDEVKANLASTGYPLERVHFVKGKVEDTIPGQMPEGPVSLLRLDTDWYRSTRHELQYLYPKLVKGGVIIIDDYGHWAGAKQAVDEYVAEHRLPLLLNRVDYTARIAVKQ